MFNLALNLPTTIVLSVSIPIFVGLVVLLVILELKKSKKAIATTSTNKSQLKGALGGETNIRTTTIKNKRLTIEVVDVKLVDLKAIAELNISCQVKDNVLKMFINDQSIIDSFNSRS
ncbi:MAG: hypothetical protein LBV55_02360 [Acholeplasmatales bacterium]|nr:hypothetical protein [Acholeplasmatales bacterium]